MVLCGTAGLVYRWVDRCVGYVHRWWFGWCLYNVGVIINAVVSNIILYIGSQKETMKSGDVNSHRVRKRFMRENNKKCYGVKMNTNKRCGSG